MCGRYDSHRSSGELAAALEAVDATSGDAAGRYNTAPTQEIRLAATNRDTGERKLRTAYWGLFHNSKIINARAETAAERPAFRSALGSRRAIIPADGWYEWVAAAGPNGRRVKQPYYMTPTDGGLLGFAGLYSWHRAGDGDGEPELTCTIITRAAVGQLVEVHHRMPLLLPSSAWSTWLDAGTDPGELLAGEPAAELVDGLELRPIGPAVGRVHEPAPDHTRDGAMPPLLHRVEPLPAWAG
jgi:putative SOS response-associated peptidase YedK